MKNLQQLRGTEAQQHRQSVCDIQRIEALNRESQYLQHLGREVLSKVMYMLAKRNS